MKKVNYKHECPEWDFMEISPEDPEFGCCLCKDWDLEDRIMEWISVKKEFPKLHQYVLVTDGKSIGMDFLTTQDSWYGITEIVRPTGMDTITHWMP